MDVPGVQASDLGGFMVKVYRRGANRKAELSEAAYQAQMRDYRAILQAPASKVDEKSFVKHGITDNIGFMLLLYLCLCILLTILDLRVASREQGP